MPIRNPIAFIGEQVTGATAGAPLSADANGQLSSGISNSRVASTSLITTTSATYVVMTGQTLTPAAGTYWAVARASVSATTNNRLIAFSIFNNGSQVADTEIFDFIRTGSGFGTNTDIGNLMTEAFVTVNGSQAIDVRWNTNGGTAQAQGYSLVLIRIS